jgi:streptomycin 6-kinase
VFDGRECVLKIGYDESSRAREIEALGLLGPPSVRLLAVLDEGVLLERVEPGTALASLPTAAVDDEATRVLARAMRTLWRPVPLGCRLPTVEVECAALHRAASASVPVPLVMAAREALAQLLATAPAPVVLHGDLHHGNLLLGVRGWVAIDPHGVVGDPLYDIGPMLINPPAVEVAPLAARRLDVLADELGADRERLRLWGLVRAVLSAAWTVESGGEIDRRVLRVADVLNG